MPYLIDGNNLMAQRAGWHRDRAGARRKLLDELAVYAQRKRVRLLVVFDGAPEAHFADGASYRGVRVFYAERNSNADERIKRMVEDSRERRTLWVVTSDRALGDYVRRTGARVMRAGEFRQEMENLIEEKTKESESLPAGEPEMKEWMRYFGVAPEDDK